MNRLVLILAIIFQGATAYAADLPSATISCERENADDVYIVHGTVEFPQGFEFYGPHMNKLAGQMNFAFADGNSVAYTKVTGHQIRRARRNEPDFYTFIATSQTGEMIQMYLRTEGYHEGFAFGEVVRQSGKTYSARSKIELDLKLKYNYREPGH